MPKSEAEIRDALNKAYDDGRLISCRFPGSGKIAISMERHMVDEAISYWSKEDHGQHSFVLGSIMRAIKSTTKRLKKRKATPAQMDALAADIALWLGHAMLHGDGENYLVKGPKPTDLQKQPA